MRRLHFARLVRVGIAIASATFAVALYRSFVFSEFEPIRVEVVTAEVYPSRQIVTIDLPDLSRFRGHTAVLHVRLQNTRSEPRRIGLSLEGLPNNRIRLPPDGVIRWTHVLSPRMVHILAGEGGVARRSLELTGDANDWILTALDVRNYHARVGDRPMIVALPAHADAHTPAAGRLPIAILVCLLALVNAPPSPRRSLRLIGRGLAVVAFGVCLTCLILPRISPYQVLFSPAAFSLIAAALFSQALLWAGVTLVGGTRSVRRRSAAMLTAAIASRRAAVARHWACHDVTFERGAALLGLCAIAIAQPLFNVVSNSPEFFPARSTTPTTVVAAVMAICVGLPLTLLGVERAIRTIGRRTAATFYSIVLALLFASVIMPFFKKSEVLAWPWDAALSVLGGLTVALACARSRIVPQFFVALAPAALVVPVLFLLDPAVRHTFLQSESTAAVQSIDRRPPIVFVIFDELSTNSLLNTDGNLDAERYPNFAALARDAYWFRNATTVSDATTYSVPAILSGRYPIVKNAVPTLQYYPVNLFTVLARHYAVSAQLKFQKLCPPRACQDSSPVAGDSVAALLSDLGVVWLHVVLPDPLTDALPPLTDDWSDFAAQRMLGVDGRRGVFARFLSWIDNRSARLYFLHSMLPHTELEFVPSGRRYSAPSRALEPRRAPFQGASAAFADMFHQRYLAQVGAVDRLLGDLIARLRDVGVYDKALVVITADHGASYREGEPRRWPQQHNLSDIFEVPLLIKLPDQHDGKVVDRIVETIDILPTLLDVVGAKASLHLDGQSLVADGVAERSSRTYIVHQANAERRTIGDLSAERARSLERKESRFGRGEVAGLYASPRDRHLLGMNLATVPSAPDVQISIRNRSQYAAVDRDRNPLPLFVEGRLTTSRSAPLIVAIALNGVVAAVTQSYRDGGAHAFGTLVPETSLRDGANAVTAVVVDESSSAYSGK